MAPDRIANHDPVEETWPEAFGVGHQGQEEAGDPDRQGADQGQVAWQEQERHRRHAGRQRDQQRVHALGQKTSGTRSMLPSTRRPSATTRGRLDHLLSSRTSCATARVAEEPEPIAIPRSARLTPGRR